MRIIKLNSYLRCEVAEVLTASNESLYYIVYRASHEEILLQQPEFAARRHRVGRVEHFRDSFGKHLLLDGLHVVAGIEDLHVEFIGRAGRVQAHEVHRASAESRDRQI